MVPQEGLSGAEVGAFVKRYLANEPGVVVRPLKHGLGFLCVDPLATCRDPKRLFTVATDGGVLLRLDPATRERIIENGIGQPNAALPDWVVHLTPDSDLAADPAEEGTVGNPVEWVWVPIGEGAGFERRRPHIAEALAYCRHQIENEA